MSELRFAHTSGDPAGPQSECTLEVRWCLPGPRLPSSTGNCGLRAQHLPSRWNPASPLPRQLGRCAFRRSRGAAQLSWRTPSGAPTRARQCIAPGTPCATSASGSRIASELHAFMLSDDWSLNYYTSLLLKPPPPPTSLCNPDQCHPGLSASPSLPGTLFTYSFKTYAFRTLPNPGSPVYPMHSLVLTPL